jgi:hypothetical protein
VTSGGRTASTPYTMKKGVSPVARLGDVWLPHPRKLINPLAVMLFQVIICTSLKALEYFCVGALHLPIALRMGNGRIADLYAQIFAVPLEGATSKLGPIVGDNSVQDPKSAYDGLDELDCGLLVDVDHRCRFRPLGEFVDDDVEELVPSDGAGKWPHDVEPPHSEGP